MQEKVQQDLMLEVVQQITIINLDATPTPTPTPVPQVAVETVTASSTASVSALAAAACPFACTNMPPNTIPYKAYPGMHACFSDLFLHKASILPAADCLVWCDMHVQRMQAPYTFTHTTSVTTPNSATHTAADTWPDTIPNPCSNISTYKCSNMSSN